VAGDNGASNAKGQSMNINQFLSENKIIKSFGGFSYRQLTPRVVCTDGFSMSVQVSRLNYCSPRIDDAEYYSEVEIGFPSETENIILEFAESPDNPTKTVYGYVPVGLVDAIIEKHGGFRQ